MNKATASALVALVLVIAYSCVARSLGVDTDQAAIAAFTAGTLGIVVVIVLSALVRPLRSDGAILALYAVVVGTGVVGATGAIVTLAFVALTVIVGAGTVFAVMTMAKHLRVPARYPLAVYGTLAAATACVLLLPLAWAAMVFVCGGNLIVLAGYTGDVRASREGPPQPWS